ncbi:DUF4307 domain-containing protein [Nocardioides sp.]|uniref:DUF4307 domain-containing protein n=1 Tax=Nocardioides sp. TaxID=35761 RepID=UPI003569C36A
MTSQEELAARYGSSAPWRRRTAIVLTTVVGLAFLGWLGWTAWEHSTPDVSSDMVGFRVVDEHTATATVRVRLKDEEVVATCVLRAFAEDHTVVGESAFTPGYDDPQPIEETVRTERRATSVELVGCTAPDQARPR